MLRYFSLIILASSFSIALEILGIFFYYCFSFILKQNINCQCNREIILNKLPQSEKEFKSNSSMCTYRKKYGLTYNSIFYQNKLTIPQYDKMIYCFLKKLSIEQATELLNISSGRLKTISNSSEMSYLRL